MIENDKQLDDKFSYDKGVVKKDIIKSIVTLATKEINGVACVDKPTNKFCSLFTDNKDRGVKVTKSKDGLIVDVYIKVYSNTQVNELAWRIQENIKTAIQTMIDVKVKAVNINVMNVDFSNIEAGDNK